MTHSRSRINELLAASFNGDPERLLFFKQCLADEVYTKHFCAVCHLDLAADGMVGNCVSCEGSDVCILCIQRYDPACRLPDEEPPSRSTYVLFLESRGLQIRPGDSICILCGLYTFDPVLANKFYSLNRALNTFDALLYREATPKQPYALTAVAFIGWTLVGRVKKAGAWTNGIMINIGFYLSFAEENRLRKVLLPHKEALFLGQLT